MSMAFVSSLKGRSERGCFRATTAISVKTTAENELSLSLFTLIISKHKFDAILFSRVEIRSGFFFSLSLPQFGSNVTERIRDNDLFEGNHKAVSCLGTFLYIIEF